MAMANCYTTGLPRALSLNWPNGVSHGFSPSRTGANALRLIGFASNKYRVRSGSQGYSLSDKLVAFQAELIPGETDEMTAHKI